MLLKGSGVGDDSVDHVEATLAVCEDDEGQDVVFGIMFEGCPYGC